MSSLRLALKQSLQETGHLAPKDKKLRRKNKKSSLSSSLRKRSRQSNKPKQRGRPRKQSRRYKHDDDDDEDDEDDDMVTTTTLTGSGDLLTNKHALHGHHNNNGNSSNSTPRIVDDEDDEDSSENEFSGDSEETDDEDDEDDRKNGDDDEDDDDEDDDDDDDEDDDEDDEEEEDEEEEDDEDEDDDEEEEEEGEVAELDPARMGLMRADTSRGREESSVTSPALIVAQDGNDPYPPKIKKPKMKRLPERSESDEERRRQRKLFKKHLNAAANKIQSHWKKAKAKAYDARNDDDDTDGDDDEGDYTNQHQQQPQHSLQQTTTRDRLTKDANQNVGNSESEAEPSAHKGATEKRSQQQRSSSPQGNPKPNNEKTKKKKKKDKGSSSDSASRTVPPPTPELLEWSRNLSERKCRRNIASGLRVKVRFSAKVKRDGKVVKKKIWYGGRVSAVSKEGSKIRIKYDDGTSEISKFPDKDVVVDDTSNGQHLVDANRFLPPSMRGAHNQEEPEEEFVENKNMLETSNESKSNTVNPSVGASNPTTGASSSEIIKVNTQPPAGGISDQSEKSADPPLTKESSVQSDDVPIPQKQSIGENRAKGEEPQATKTDKPFRIEISTTPAPTISQGQRPSKMSENSIVLPTDSEPPEEGELSPGITPPLNMSKLNEKQPVEVSSTAEPQAQTEAAESLTSTDNISPATKSSNPVTVKTEKIESEVALSASKLGSPGKSPDEKKSSLTIRIPNVKSKDALLMSPKPQPTPKSPKPPSDGETSEEELFADTPVTQREVKSIDLRKFDGTKKKLSKKRQASEASEAPHPKRRIHLKRDREVAAAAAAAAANNEDAGASTQEGKDDESGEIKQEPVLVSMPILTPKAGDQSSPKEPRISISLKKATPENELDMPMAPAATKTKRRKDRANSPNPRRSPVNPRRSPVNESDQLPGAIKESDLEPGTILKPVSRQMKKSASVESGESAMETAPVTRKGVIGSRNSAFARRTPALKDDATNPQVQSDGDGQNDSDDPPIAKLVKSRDGPKGSSDASGPSSRSGRRAAQQAKEKLNTKSESNTKPESNSKSESAVQESIGKKKKKRRRKDMGDSDGEESDHSEDDRQWVQCDSCAKWRILPSSVKVSSLPKHWYCHLNVYDPKRNNCTAPEQTLKQVAKERRRAKKRAKQQRLEQAQLESIPEDGASKEKEKVSTPVNSPKSTKVVISAKKLAAMPIDPKRSALAINDEPQQSDSGSDTFPKAEKKTRKGRQQQQNQQSQQQQIQQQQQQQQQQIQQQQQLQQQQQQDDGTDGQNSAAESNSDAPKVKVGRKRGRPARIPGAEPGKTSQEKKEDDNVQWVQCEKCEKWRKLPAHIEAGELPETWYCSMNTWNPDAASCEWPEDKADASHLEVGKVHGQGQGQVPQGNPGKNSYRSLIFGTGRKHNRPMSERSRAAESLFMRPIDEEENPHPSVMYSKSSVFLPKTSNFTKSNSTEEKRPSIFDVLSNSELWAELSGVSHPQNILSNSSMGTGYPKFITFENLPEEIKRSIREAVLDALGSNAHTGDDLISFMKKHSWDSELAEVVPYFNADTIINALLALVRDGIVEMACFRDPSVPMHEWIPKYRRVRSRRALACEEAMRASKCIKIRKPWKQREENSSDWVSGGAAFS